MPDELLPATASFADVIGADEIAAETIHPDVVAEMLEGAGFVAASERSFQGGTGALTRATLRLLTFATPEGAAAYLRWFREHAGTEIVTARPVSVTDVPDGAIVLFHEPDGCCRRDLPVYLAAWRRGATVFSVHAGGRRRNDRAIAQLTTAFDFAVRTS